jgi:hypothetical protein
MAIAALVVAIVSALCAAYAVWYARRQAAAADRSAAASERSAVAAEGVAALEASRRHAELTPRFRVSFDRSARRLTVFLVGPPELGRLDSLTVTIRDDRPGRVDLRLPAGPAAEEIAAQIWGLYRFIPGGVGLGLFTDREFRGADETGRVTPTGGMAVGESLVFAMEVTRPPKWSAESLDDWARRCGPLIRLQLDCRREGMEPWSLPVEVDSVTGKAVEVP